ncbi:MAG: GGDEF domain-containing protein [Agarilytica sp.]
MRWIQDDRLMVRSLELLFSQAGSALASSGIASLILIYAFWSELDGAFVIAWLTSFCAIAIYRLYNMHFFSSSQNKRAEAGAWFVRFAVSILMMGILWGVLLAYIAPGAEGVKAAVLIANYSFLLAGSVTGTAVSFPVFLMFSLPIVVPGVLYLMFSQLDNHWMLAAVTLGWYLFMVSAARRFGEFSQRSLANEYQNKELVLELEEQNRRAELLAQELMVLSNTDSLTNLYNRRHFDDCLEAEMRRVHRTSGELSLLMCDVDYFKNFNDAVGHVEGDKCLQQVAEVLVGSARQGTDMVARYGGEEFAFILASTSAEQARVFAERLRQAVVAKVIPHPDSDVSPYVTISVGVSSVLDVEHETAKHLIERADRALYRAKELGRNKVELQSLA